MSRPIHCHPLDKNFYRHLSHSYLEFSYLPVSSTLFYRVTNRSYTQWGTLLLSEDGEVCVEFCATLAMCSSLPAAFAKSQKVET